MGRRRGRQDDRTDGPVAQQRGPVAVRRDAELPRDGLLTLWVAVVNAGDRAASGGSPVGRCRRCRGRTPRRARPTDSVRTRRPLQDRKFGGRSNRSSQEAGPAGVPRPEAPGVLALVGPAAGAAAGHAAATAAVVGVRVVNPPVQVEVAVLSRAVRRGERPRTSVRRAALERLGRVQLLRLADGDRVARPVGNRGDSAAAVGAEGPAGRGTRPPACRLRSRSGASG